MASAPKPSDPTPATPATATPPPEPAAPAKGRRPIDVIRAELAQADAKFKAVEAASMREWQHYRELEQQWNEARAKQRHVLRISGADTTNPFLHPVTHTRPTASKDMIARTALLHSLTIYTCSLKDELRGYSASEQSAADRSGVFESAGFDFSECARLDPPPPPPPDGWQAEQNRLLARVNAKWATAAAAAV
jgi:hypothetical protein